MSYVLDAPRRASRPLPAFYEPPAWEVDCQENPFDLRPAVDTIMKAENWLLDRMPRNQKLVIVMGEHHRYQTHILLQKAVLMAHHEAEMGAPYRRFAFGYESEHDYVFTHTGHRLHDPHGQIAMRAHQKFHDGTSADARADLFDYCLRHKISVSFNDVAVSNGCIDYEDRQARDLAEEYMPHLLSRQAPYREADAGGIALSNLAMVKNAIDHIERSRARIYIQQCGQAHALGDAEQGYDLYDSLTVRFRQHGFAVMPVICSYEVAEYYIPRAASSYLDEGVKIRHIDNTTDHIDFEPVRRYVSRNSCLDL